MTTTKTTKHDKTKAKSGKSTPKERDSTARTISYCIIIIIIIIIIVIKPPSTVQCI